MAVAADTRDDVHCSVLVTGRAVQADVSLDERETGVGMIEKRVRPGCRLMAGITFLAVTTLMVVIHRMAIHATAVKAILVALATMTVVALQTIMAVDQGETGCRMVESNAAPRRC